MLRSLSRSYKEVKKWHIYTHIYTLYIYIHNIYTLREILYNKHSCVSLKKNYTHTHTHTGACIVQNVCKMIQVPCRCCTLSGTLFFKHLTESRHRNSLTSSITDLEQFYAVPENQHHPCRRRELLTYCSICHGRRVTRDIMATFSSLPLVLITDMVKQRNLESLHGNGCKISTALTMRPPLLY